MYLLCFVFAFIVRLSKWLFCDIWSSFFTQNDPFILKHYLLIVTIMYHVSSIEVSVFIQVITILSQHITLKWITINLLAYMRTCNLTTCFVSFFSMLCCLSIVYKMSLLLFYINLCSFVHSGLNEVWRFGMLTLWYDVASTWRLVYVFNQWYIRYLFDTAFSQSFVWPEILQN